MLIDSYRVLDLCDEKGALCGRLLADLGADVIKVERTGGDPSRNVGPFYQNIPHPERSLTWWALNAGKKSVTLNLETADGRHILKRMVERADIVIESFPPGHLESLGLAYEKLSAINPRLIMASISPFGQDGPYRDHKGSDLTVMAEGGLMYVTGSPETPPLRITVPQAFAHASLHAAIGILIALCQRHRTGTGDYVDVSAQDTILPVTMFAPFFWRYNQIIETRTGHWRRRGTLLQRYIWPCKDGYVTWALFGGLPAARANKSLVEWLDSEGKAGWLKTLSLEFGVDLGTMTDKENAAWEEIVGNFFLSHTKAELYEGAMKYKIHLCPVQNIADMANDPQLTARGFWTKVTHDELGCELTYPGPWWLSSEVAPSIRDRAPLIGEHNAEVYESWLGVTGKDLSTLKEAEVI